MIYFIGAGPGDPDLITVKAQKFTNCRCSIIYRFLKTKEVLSWCKK